LKVFMNSSPFPAGRQSSRGFFCILTRVFFSFLRGDYAFQYSPKHWLFSPDSLVSQDYSYPTAPCGIAEVLPLGRVPTHLIISKSMVPSLQRSDGSSPNLISVPPNCGKISHPSQMAKSLSFDLARFFPETSFPEIDQFSGLQHFVLLVPYRVSLIFHYPLIPAFTTLFLILCF